MSEKIGYPEIRKSFFFHRLRYWDREMAGNTLLMDTRRYKYALNASRRVQKVFYNKTAC